MITKEVIDAIYKKYKRPAPSADCLDLGLLFDYAIENHGIYVDEGNLVIDSLGEDSPFHEIALDHVCGILEFERHVAVVLENAIIFLDKADSGAHVHLKPEKMSLMDRLRLSIADEDHPDF